MAFRTASLLISVPVLLMIGCAPSDPDPVDLGYDGAGDVIEGEFVIQDHLTDRELDELGLIELAWNDNLGWGLYLAEDGVAESALDRALAQSRTVGIEPNRPRQSFAVNDPYRSLQWNMTAIDVDGAWAYSTGRGVTVAVIDTGLGKVGEDRPANVLTGKDWVDGDSDPTDQNGHGTHVSGTIAQKTNNGKGCIGVAPDATILPLRVLGADGSGDAYAIAEAITYAADQGAKVINLSLGSAYGTNVERDAVRYAQGKGVVIVAASGNESATSVGYPATYDGVIAVGATRYDGAVAAYSNGGSTLDVVAPGGDMAVDQNRDGYNDGILQEVVIGTQHGYDFYEGTSMASPHVAGVAALLISAGARPQDVLGLLTSTAKDVGATGFDNRAGYGLIQPVKALQKFRSGTTPPATTPPPPTADTSAPTITDVWAQQTSTSLTIGWTTNEASTTYVAFDGYGTFGDASLVTAHEIRFTVQTNKVYNFTVVSKDAAGNEGRDGVYRSR